MDVQDGSLNSSKVITENKNREENMGLVILGVSTEGSIEQCGFFSGTAWVWIPALFQRTNNLSVLQYFHKCKVDFIASTL